MSAQDRPSAPRDLKCEYRSSPLAIDETQPHLFWKMSDSRRGAVQSAYRVMVASSPDLLKNGHPNIWDSGKTQSNQSIHVEYGGPPLGSRDRCFWQVQTWDGNDEPSPPTNIQSWEMGLLSDGDWSAQWIAMVEGSDRAPAPVHYLRKEFTVDKPIARARLYATALGVYDVNIDGSKVGDHLLAPGWTDYTQRALYQTYDVTDQLVIGENAIGARLAVGWYTGPLTWTNQRNVFGEPPPLLLLQLEIEADDGSISRIVSDDSWTCKLGPIIHSELYEGEKHDARLEMPGWDLPEYDESAWSKVDLVDTPNIAVTSELNPPIRITGEIRPVSITEISPGIFIFDMGQNMVGVCRLRVTGDAGTEITMRFAEVLDRDRSGNVYTDNLRGAACTDTYICAGAGLETFEPAFTYHGFRYVEITGFPGTPDVSTLTGRIFHSDMPQTGMIETSSEVVNRTFENLMWSCRGNHHSSPTDCPQRDERMGWTGDAQVFCRTACFTHDMTGFYGKFILDMLDAQTEDGYFSDVAPHCYEVDRLANPGAAGWADAGILIPWAYYLAYGDRRLIERNYDDMARYVDTLARQNPNGLWLEGRNNDFGDWVPAGEDSDKDMFATLYYLYSTKLLAKMSHLVGKDERAAEYDALVESVRSAFNARYLLDGHYLNPTQTLISMALVLGVPPDGHLESIIQDLADDVESRGWHLSTGFHGTRFIVQALSENGHHAAAVRLAVNRDYPSWGYQIGNGATTIWERWNGDVGDPYMNSLNHYAFGSVGEWMFRHLAGIQADPEEPGFKRFSVAPNICGPDQELNQVAATFESLHGRIVSEWQVTSNLVKLNVEIPANTSAQVVLPNRDFDKITESGLELKDAQGIGNIRDENGAVVCDIESGRYSIICR